MAVYKFKVTYEDHEDVYREIEIRSDQTFEDLHLAIQKAISFDNSQPASFYMSDASWRKGQEITLMGKSRLADFMDDPHQKMIYIFDFKACWTFLVELVKINVDTPKGDFPRCVKTVGSAPKQYKKVDLPPPGEEEDEEDRDSEESIFMSEEGYDRPEGDEEEEDALIEGEEEGGASEEEAPAEED